MQNPITIWLAALTRPSQETYETIYNAEGARTRTALLWIVLSSFASVLISLIGKTLLPYHPLNQLAQRNSGSLSTEQAQRLVDSMQWMMSPWLWFFLAPFMFLLFIGISHFTGIILGGRGKFGPYSYLMASIQVPIGLVTVLLSWIPFLGQCLTTLISLGMYVYFVMATKAAYKFGTGKAIVTALAPLVIFMLLFMCYMMFAVMTVLR